MIKIERAYDPPSADDGRRYLVDRLWPRGLKKEGLELAGWIRDVAPSDELRRWFAHDPKRWDRFRRRYFAELDKKREVWQPVLESARGGTVTLVYGATDAEHNNAVALKSYLEGKLEEGAWRGTERGGSARL